MNVGKSVQTPDEVLFSMEEGDREPVPSLSNVQVEVEAGGLDPFQEQEALMDELGVGKQTHNDDGSVTVDFSEDETAADKPVSGEFGDNLAETLDAEVLATISQECLDQLRIDKDTRKDWEEMLARGLRLLGMSVEERHDPWPKACGVFHPVLLEAVTRGWAKTVRDLAPARGPAKAELNSKKKGIAKRLRRVTKEVNCVILNDVPGYSDEQSRLAFMVHLSGSGFKKTYYNSVTKKIENRYIHPLDLIMPYGTTDIDQCPRICHKQLMFPSEVVQLMDGGMWKEISLPSPVSINREEPRKEQDATDGRTPPSIPSQHEILEFHVDLKVKGDDQNTSRRAVPYLVVIDKASQQVLNVRRNWKEGSDYERRRYFTAYQYITGYSVYGIGLVHLIGGIAEGGTSILRQLVDAGTLSNLPAGFRTRGFRVREDDKPLKPGEWRDVDFQGTKLSDSIMPLPFKEPSAVLAGLLDKLVDEARRTASSIDAAVSDIGKEAPVGSVLAILEESLVIQNSVKIGFLRSLSRELDIMMDIVKERYGAYRYVDDDDADFEKDFAAPLRVIPSTDPNASSMAQRVVAYREAINTAQAAPPNTYDHKELHRSFLEAMEIPNADKIVPLDDEIDPLDPVSENMRVLMKDPVKVFDHQHHESHIAVHMAMVQDPLIQQMVGQSPDAASIQAAIAAHIAEHVAYLYRQKIEAIYGQALPDPEKPLPEEVERALAPQLAQAAQQVLAQSKQQNQQQEAQKLAEDPLVQLKIREVGVKEGALELNAVKTAAEIADKAERLQLDTESKAIDAAIRLLEVTEGVDVNKKRLTMETLVRLKDISARTAAEKSRQKAMQNNNGNKGKK
ncbi:MAG: hypothetical protein B7Z37_23325 [Verrucomicrobia bacterium 12-59-8]|nr:MAG: hypothetical protein B7Z37_23325 [Verrucomicrobia bacterium 12-59-8]